MELIEYGDYECPYCGEAQNVIEELRAEFGESLRFVFRNFPLTELHPHAWRAAQAAEAARLQGKFWSMHDLLYANQNELEEENLLEYAATLDLDLDRFIRDIDSDKVNERIERDVKHGNQAGVEGTPTFFIDGKRHAGDWTYESLREALLEERARAA